MQVQPNQAVNQQLCFQVLAKSREEFKKVHQISGVTVGLCIKTHRCTNRFRNASFFLAEKQIPTFRHAPYLPDRALCDLSLSHIENCSHRNSFSVN